MYNRPMLSSGNILSTSPHSVLKHCFIAMSFCWSSALWTVMIAQSMSVAVLGKSCVATSGSFFLLLAALHQVHHLLHIICICCWCSVCMVISNFAELTDGLFIGTKTSSNDGKQEVGGGGVIMSDIMCACCTPCCTWFTICVY